MKLEYIIRPDNICQFYRNLKITNIDWRTLDKIAYINCNIQFGNYSGDIFQPLELRIYPDYSIVLTIDNTTLVNPLTGEQIADGENEENCTLGEYDFFINSLNNNIPLNILLESGINRSILRGRHNV